jgi:hypothetical protein
VRRPVQRATSDDYGFFVDFVDFVVVVLVIVVSAFFADVSILAAAESIFMPVSVIAGAGAMAGAAVSAFGVSFVLQAAMTSTAATRARRFM